MTLGVGQATVGRDLNQNGSKANQNGSKANQNGSKANQNGSKRNASFPEEPEEDADDDDSARHRFNGWRYPTNGKPRLKRSLYAKGVRIYAKCV